MQETPSPLPAEPETGYVFRGLRIDSKGRIFRGKVEIELPREESLVLRVLLAHAGRAVTPAQLRRAVWGGTPVPSKRLAQCIGSLRTRLGLEDCIQALGRRGFRLWGDVRVFSSKAQAPPVRLALLPFAVEPGVPNYFAPAIVEAAATELEHTLAGATLVRAHESIRTLARRHWPQQQIGAAVAADLAVSGTLRLLPTHFLLRAEMLRIADGQPLWSEELVTPRASMENLGTELARLIRWRLDGPLPATPEIAAAIARPEHDEAYGLLARARDDWQSMERHRMHDGLQRLERAIELDPALTAARVELVNLCVTEAFFGYAAPSQAAEHVHRAAGPVRRDDPGGAAMLPGLGWILYHVDRDLPAALQAFSLSQHLPHDPWTTRARSMFALSRHRFSEAIDLLRLALGEDPYSAWMQAQLAWALHLAGETQASQNGIERALIEFPENLEVGLFGALLLAYDGRAERAVAIAEELVRRVPWFDPAVSTLAYTLARAGRGGQAHEVLEQLEWMSRERFVLGAFTPAAHMALGEPEAALESLHSANAARSPWVFQMLADPRLAPLRESQGFQAIRAEWQALEDSAGNSA